MEFENERTECVNEKENKNVDEFNEFILPQKPANKNENTKWHEGMEAVLFTRKRD